jgi:hypothetical protein
MWGMFALGAVIGATVTLIVRGGLSAWNERDLRNRHLWLIDFVYLTIDLASGRQNDPPLTELADYGRHLLKWEEGAPTEEEPPTSGSHN